jgi:bifunctional non-homologous end joining protein LigD
LRKLPLLERKERLKAILPRDKLIAFSHHRKATGKRFFAQAEQIAGFTAPKRTRPFFGALVLAVRENNAWRYIGHVGTGFSHATLGELHGKLTKLKAAKSPFPAKVKDEGVTTWVKPSLVAEIKFAEWTSKGELRQPVYLGLRSDKKAKDVVRERERPRK